MTGQPVPLRLDGRTVFGWWGQDVLDNDRLATRGGQLVLAASAAGLEDLATSQGWISAASGGPEGEEDGEEEDGGEEDGGEEDGGEEDTTVIDVDVVRSWLSRPGTAVPLAAALNVWNIATDVAYSCGRVRSDRGHWEDRCYGKLFAANVPWAVGRVSYRPRWLRQELRVLRRVEGEAVGLLRWALSAPLAAE